MHQRIPAFLVLTAVICLASAADPPQRPKDPQSNYEPRSEPGAGQAFLQKFVGDWEVDKTFYRRSGAPVHMKGQCQQAMIHGGRFLRSEFVFGNGDDRTTGTGIIGFEPGSGTFTSVWTDSRSTRMSLRQSKGAFNSKEIVLYSASLTAAGKGARRSRTVTRLDDGGHKIVHRQYAAGQDGKERLMMELLLTRRGKVPGRQTGGTR
jgi:hypothetical protein